MAQELNCSLKVSKSELLLHYYIHFETNLHGKGIEPSYPLPNYGLNSITTFF